MKHKSRRQRPRLFLKGRSPRARRRLLAVFILVFGAAGARSARAACVELSSPLHLATASGGPTFVVAADIDRDGDLDAVIPTQSDGKLAWFANDGAGGGWAIRTISLAAGFTQGLAVSDLDGDGDLDVVSTSTSPSRVSWYANDGAGGGWSAQTVTSALNGPWSVAVGDFDRDGDPDLVSAAVNGLLLDYYRNDGSGGGWTAAGVSTTTNSAISLAAGDLDGDGDLDLLAAAAGNDAVVWFRNNGSGGGWTKGTISALLLDPRSVAVADVDSDGDLDVLSAWRDDTIAWHENTAGDGSSWSFGTISLDADNPYFVTTADIDGDGDPDVLSASLEDDETTWFENGGGALWTAHAFAPAGDNPYVLFAADVDGDGDSDLLSALIGDGKIAWYRNQQLHGDAMFGAVQSISTFALAPQSLAIADLDGDGDLDPLIANDGGDAIDWWRNNGSATGWVFQEPVGSAEGSRVAVAGDLDRDGDLDLVGAATINNALTWYPNDGLGAFPASTIDLALTTPEAIALADFDGNGTLDVAVSDTGLDAVFWYANDGTPSTGSWTRLTVATGLATLARLEAVDLDRDGDSDLVGADSIGDVLLWFESSGAAIPAWTKRTLADLLDVPTTFGTGDLDADGDVDAVVATALGTLVWLESDSTPATGAWTRHTVVTGSGEFLDLAVADLDSDGDLDAAVVGGADSATVLFENDGTGLFVASTVTTLIDVTEIASADLDRDGDLDLALTTTSALVWVPNLGTKVHDDGFDSDANTACWSSAVP